MCLISCNFQHNTAFLEMHEQIFYVVVRYAFIINENCKFSVPLNMNMG